MKLATGFLLWLQEIVGWMVLLDEIHFEGLRLVIGVRVECFDQRCSVRSLPPDCARDFHDHATGTCLAHVLHLRVGSSEDVDTRSWPEGFVVLEISPSGSVFGDPLVHVVRGVPDHLTFLTELFPFTTPSD